MGGNGSFIAHSADTEGGREYRTIYKVDDNIKIIERKNSKLALKLPQESHSPNRVYAIFRKDGLDVKEIAIYDDNGKRVYTIHTQRHKGLLEHYHVWRNGQPVENEVYALTPDLKLLLQKVRNINH